MQVAPTYPDWLAPDLRTLRGVRMAELLAKAGTEITVEQAMHLAVDIRDLNAVREKKALCHAAHREPALTEAVRLLAEWDGELSADSRGAALFQAWLMQPMVAGRLSVGGWVTPDYQTLPAVAEADPARAVVALLDAVEWLQAYGYPLDVTWGELHRLRRGDVDLPMDGGLDSLCPNGGRWDDTTGKIVVGFGSSYRCLAEPDGEATRLWACLPWGNSDDPASPHFTNQMELAAKRGYRQVPWTRAAVEAEAIAIIVL